MVQLDRFEHVIKSYKHEKIISIIFFGPVVESDVKFVVKVNIISSGLIGGYLTLDLNQPIKWEDFPLDALLADMMLNC
jgi:hypothetical protein